MSDAYIRVILALSSPLYLLQDQKNKLFDRDEDTVFQGVHLPLSWFLSRQDFHLGRLLPAPHCLHLLP